MYQILTFGILILLIYVITKKKSNSGLFNHSNKSLELFDFFSLNYELTKGSLNDFEPLYLIFDNESSRFSKYKNEINYIIQLGLTTIGLSTLVPQVKSQPSIIGKIMKVSSDYNLFLNDPYLFDRTFKKTNPIQEDLLNSMISSKTYGKNVHYTLTSKKELNKNLEMYLMVFLRDINNPEIAIKKLTDELIFSFRLELNEIKSVNDVGNHPKEYDLIEEELVRCFTIHFKKCIERIGVFRLVNQVNY
jgi:hypothetical protein